MKLNVDRVPLSRKDFNYIPERNNEQYKDSTLKRLPRLASIKHLQHLILGRIQDSNAVISHFNDFSENCFTQLSDDFGFRKNRIFSRMKQEFNQFGVMQTSTLKLLLIEECEVWLVHSPCNSFRITTRSTWDCCLPAQFQTSTSTEKLPELSSRIKQPTHVPPNNTPAESSLMD
ncbi:hypothetical protein Leryth_018481 [Lithospermum erythrorhizon]|nr:hypothetical protein Leryth_018481 [Lithospermum erythrorhizon]